MRYLCLILTACFSYVAVAQKTEAEQRVELMQEFQYSDEKQCYAIITQGEAPSPILNLLVAAYGLETDKAAVKQALEIALQRGCDVNVLGVNGLSPLHEAILFNDVEMLRFLLEYGADPEQKIQRPHSEIDGMNAKAFLDKILLISAEKGRVRDGSALQAVLAEYEAKIKSAR